MDVPVVRNSYAVHARVVSRYNAVNATLLNEFPKGHRRVAEQQHIIAELKTTVTQQQKQIEALAAGLQKVRAAVELNKRAPTQVADIR